MTPLFQTKQNRRLRAEAKKATVAMEHKVELCLSQRDQLGGMHPVGEQSGLEEKQGDTAITFNHYKRSNAMNDGLDDISSPTPGCVSCPNEKMKLEAAVDQSPNAAATRTRRTGLTDISNQLCQLDNAKVGKFIEDTNSYRVAEEVPLDYGTWKALFHVESSRVHMESSSH